MPLAVVVQADMPGMVVKAQLITHRLLLVAQQMVRVAVAVAVLVVVALTLAVAGAVV
jgi:hypothetical protein